MEPKMRTFKFISLLVLLALVLGACATPATKAPTAEPTVAATEIMEAEPTAEPTEVPATEVPAAEPTEAPTAEPTAEPEPLPEGVANILTVNLREGLQWSDGANLTAQDLVGTYNIYWAQSNAVWTYLKDVVAVDDTTVEFWISNPAPRALRLILRAYQPAPYAQYGPWMDQAAQMRADGVDPKGDEVKAFLDDLYAFKPESIVAYGPFIIDPASVTEAQMEMPKNDTGYHADLTDIQKILVYYGETAVSLPYVLSNDADYTTHAYTPSDVEIIKTMPNLTVLSGPTGTGPGLWFNQAYAPLTHKEVRQAFAYIIDRAENATVAMGDAGKGVEYVVGFTDLQVPAWLSEETIAKLNPYATDWAKAEELLTGIGFSKNADGKWLTDAKEHFTVELAVPSDFLDWLASAENAAQQLQAFGIDAVVRGYPSSERATIQKEGTYQILVDLSIYYNPPHPHTSFNYYLTAPRNNPETTDNLYGMNFPWTQTVEGEEVYIPDLLAEAAAGFDFEAHKPAIQKLALLINEELPVLGLFERYATDVIDLSTRITGWRDFSDPIYKNNQSDLYVAIQLLEGDLQVSETGDGSFHTVYPYPQPPNYDLNYFTSTSLIQGAGNPSYNVMFPPLFYYMWADASFVPAVAESYSLR
jgi:peptide/nickel transport system substrate-binding protein